jgi:hypothetical protein
MPKRTNTLKARKKTSDKKVSNNNLDPTSDLHHQHEIIPVQRKSIPVWMYDILMTFFNLGGIGLGVMLVVFLETIVAIPCINLKIVRLDICQTIQSGRNWLASMIVVYIVICCCVVFACSIFHCFKGCAQRCSTVTDTIIFSPVREALTAIRNKCKLY